MMRLMRHVRRIFAGNKGMTLVELLVTLALLSVLTLSVVTLLPPSVKIYQDSTNLSRSNLMLSDTLDWLSDEMMYGSDFASVGAWQASDGALTSFTYESQAYGDVLYQKENAGAEWSMKRRDPKRTGQEDQYLVSILFDQEFYMGNSVSVTITPFAKNTGTAGQEPIYDVVCIKAHLKDRNGKDMGGQERYVDLLNGTFKPKI